MPLYSFRCQRNHVQEALRPMNVDRVHCACGQPAYRVAANRVAIVGPEVDTRNMYRRFTEASQEMDYSATKIESATGQSVATPPLWRMAKRRAQAMIAAGEAPVFKKES